MKHLLLTAALLLAPIPAIAKDGLQQQVETVLAQAGPGTRWGVVVSDEHGTEIVTIDPEGRYMPASNTKLFTTAAAFWKLGLQSLEESDQAGRASAYVLKRTKLPPDVVLVGRGDARLSSAPDCQVDCLAVLADQVAARTRKVSAVSGDDSEFVDERWSPGMSWNNISTRSGTGISALSLDNNEAVVTVTPGKTPETQPQVVLPGYFKLINMALTGEAITSLRIERMPGSREVTLWGMIAAKSPPQTLVMGIDDPADYATWRFAEMLRKRGVRISGRVGKALPQWKQSAGEAAEIAVAKAVEAVKELDPVLLAPPLIEDMSIINKQSQNLHAELLLRRLGAHENPEGSIETGQKVITAMLTEAGLKPHQYFFADGSGMSTYNRVAPRGVVSFLRWTQAQPWGAKFRATLPIGGIDGTLANRFKGTSLEGRITAKTGTINATHALAGFFTTKSGRTLTFAAYANDVPEGIAATRLVDQALVLMAEAM